MAIARFLDHICLALRASGLYSSATLRCKIGLRPHALHPGAIQGKEGIKFCHLATLPDQQGRKPTLLLPFVGHLLSGVVPVLVVYFESWPPTVLYAANLYNFFGGYTLLVIAMNGYVGDVTTAK